MKKTRLILGMIACVLGLTACGSQEESMFAKSQHYPEDQIVEQVKMNSESLIVNLDMITAEGDFTDADLALMPNMSATMISSWQAVTEDMGTMEQIVSHEVEIDGLEIVDTVLVKGSKRDAKVETAWEFDKDMGDLQLTSLSANAVFGVGELMVSAAQNTVIGMGTVFAVLILISLVISGFKYIPNIQAAFSRKKEEPKEPVKETAPVPAASVQEEELSDDLELVAVIAAAIAVSQGASTTDGFVVRSIRRAKTNNWRNA